MALVVGLGQRFSALERETLKTILIPRHHPIPIKKKWERRLALARFSKHPGDCYGASNEKAQV